MAARQHQRHFGGNAKAAPMFGKSKAHGGGRTSAMPPEAAKRLKKTARLYRSGNYPVPASAQMYH